MTNYNKWDKFDVDLALEETDKADAKSDFKVSVQNKTKSSIDEQARRQRKVKDAVDKASLQAAVDSLLSANKLPGYYRYYKTACKECKSIGLCPHRRDTTDGEAMRQNEVSCSSVDIVTDSIEISLGQRPEQSVVHRAINEARVEDDFYDVTCLSDRIMALSNSLADILILVQTLHAHAEVCVVISCLIFIMP